MCNVSECVIPLSNILQVFTNVIYVARCKKHQILYVGHTSETLATRFAKHQYDIKKRPNNSELAEHFYCDHDIEKDLDVTIVQTDLPNRLEREHMENRWMCKLQTCKGTGLNVDCGPYAKEVYNIWSQL